MNFKKKKTFKYFSWSTAKRKKTPLTMDGWISCCSDGQDVTPFIYMLMYVKEKELVLRWLYRSYSGFIHMNVCLVHHMWLVGQPKKTRLNNPAKIMDFLFKGRTQL